MFLVSYRFARFIYLRSTTCAKRHHSFADSASGGSFLKGEYVKNHNGINIDWVSGKFNAVVGERLITART